MYRVHAHVMSQVDIMHLEHLKIHCYSAAKNKLRKMKKVT